MAKFLGNFESGSAEWLALRSEPGVVTGTLAGTVCGVNPWESPFTAWAKATGQIPSEVKQSLAMRFGQVFEAGIKTVWQEQNPGWNISSDVGTWAHKDYEWARANPDGMVTDPSGNVRILEVKTARVPFTEVPPHYRYQVWWYQWVMDLTEHPAILIALFSGNDLQTFEIDFDAEAFEGILAAVDRWRDHVLTGKKPDWDGSQSTFETVKLLNPEIVDSSEDLGDLGQHLFLAQDRFDQAEAELRELKSRTLDAMGNAKYGYSHEILVATRSVNRNGIVSLTVKKGK